MVSIKLLLMVCTSTVSVKKLENSRLPHPVGLGILWQHPSSNTMACGKKILTKTIWRLAHIDNNNSDKHVLSAQY